LKFEWRLLVPDQRIGAARTFSKGAAHEED
jgi:hypothetical protein